MKKSVNPVRNYDKKGKKYQERSVGIKAISNGVKGDEKNKKTATKPEKNPIENFSVDPPASDDSAANGNFASTVEAKFPKMTEIMSTRPVRNEAEKALSSIAWTSNGVNQCVYCTSKNIVKRGKRQNKLEEVQLYICQDCGKTFTGKKIKGKKYPTRMILDGVSYYNVGFSLDESAKFLERSYGVKVDASTISHWVKELADLCSYGRLREFGLKIYSPAQVVQSFQMYHRQIYRFRYHRAKTALALQEFGHYRFAPLREYLDSIATDCPHYLFKESDRSSEIKAEMDLHEVRITEKQNRATQLAQLVLQAVADNKWRHDALQKFMLANDSVTVATEVPVFFEREDYDWMQDNLKFEIPFEMERTITGHIDFIQIRNKSVHILDYKPDASKARPVAQLTFYALALSRLTGLRLFDFKCAWFDEKNYYEFFPLHVVYKKKKRGRGRGKGKEGEEEPKKQITHTEKIIEN
ncbi:MAG: PD-(D/E)XK nuclease family protein [Parcubacteria group bacterium]|jgi:transposase-like protein